jgi:hypothetical protein
VRPLPCATKDFKAIRLFAVSPIRSDGGADEPQLRPNFFGYQKNFRGWLKNQAVRRKTLVLDI